MSTFSSISGSVGHDKVIMKEVPAASSGPSHVIINQDFDKLAGAIREVKPPVVTVTVPDRQVHQTTGDRVVGISVDFTQLKWGLLFVAVPIMAHVVLEYLKHFL